MFVYVFLFVTTFLVGEFFISNVASAYATITAATGGTTISADTVGGVYTTLTGPVLSESAAGQIKSNNGQAVITLTAPTGFEFDTSNHAIVTLTEGNGTANNNINNLAINDTIVTTTPDSSHILFTITSQSSSSKNTLTYSNIRVRPTAGTPLSGNLVLSSTGMVLTADVDVSLLPANAGALTEVAGALASIIVSPDTLSLTVGDPTQSLTATMLDHFDNSVTGTLTWISSIPSVATVDSSGVVTAVSAGSTNITASSGGVTSAIPSVITVNVIKADQVTLTVNAISGGVIYGTTATLDTTGGSGEGAVTYNIGESTGCSVLGDVLSVTNASDTCSITATKATDTNYNATTSELLTITLHKANSNITTWPTATGITYGQTLSDSTLSSGTSTPDGTFAFTTPTTTPNAGTADYEVTFIPNDTTNYNEATGSISVTVNKATHQTTSGSYIRPLVALTPVVTTAPIVGKVLGTEKFNFTRFIKFKTLSYKVSIQGNEVMELQKLLNNFGNTLVIDGKFGPKTKGAVIKFQIANKLVGDGVVGAKTRAVLNK